MRISGLGLLCLALVGCGDDGNSGGSSDANNNNGIDAKIYMDAPASMITISGTATEQGLSSGPLAGVTVAAYRNTDENTVVAMTTTDGMGKYSLTIMTNGQALDGFLKATKAGFKDTYLYPPEPLGASFDKAAINMVTPGNYDLISTLAQGNQQPGKALIGLLVTDGTNPVAGATVSSTPASSPYRYNGANGLPSSTATSTQADGVAYMFNTTAGQVTVTAAKSGATFKSHGLKAWADQLTTTLVIQ